MTTIGWLIETSILLYITLVLPVQGKRNYLRLIELVSVDPNARVRHYWRMVRREWGLVVLAELARILQREPILRLSPTFPHSSPIGKGLVLGFFAGLVASFILWPLVPKLRPRLRRQLEPVKALLPVTRRERYAYVAVAITAGFCEEVLYRGLLMRNLSSLGLPMTLTVAIAAASFGWAHLYQGWKGVLTTGAVGLVLALIYVYTGSLLWPIFGHVLMDLRLLVLLPPVNGERGLCPPHSPKDREKKRVEMA